MNTLEARQRLAELTTQAIQIVEALALGAPVSSANSIEIREILREAREIAYDAGYPGDPAWRALLRTNVYITTPPADVDQDFWSDSLFDLQAGLESLNGVTQTADA
jgi:hypothetical protein